MNYEAWVADTHPYFSKSNKTPKFKSDISERSREVMLKAGEINFGQKLVIDSTSAKEFIELRVKIAKILDNYLESAVVDSRFSPFTYTDQLLNLIKEEGYVKLAKDQNLLGKWIEILVVAKDPDQEDRFIKLPLSSTNYRKVEIGGFLDNEKSKTV